MALQGSIVLFSFYRGHYFDDTYWHGDKAQELSFLFMVAINWDIDWHDNKTQELLHGDIYLHG